jgi:phage tail sheath gpL-like
LSIAFNSIPLTIRTPGSYVEFDSSRATKGVQVQPHETLLIGQKLATGSATAGQVYQPRSPDDAIALFGAKSQLAQMVKAYRANDSLTPLNCIAQADAGSTVLASGSITVSGTATEAGNTPLYISGRRVNVAVTNTMTAAQWETAALAALALEADLTVTCAADAGTGVDFSAVNGGTAGNDIYLGVCLLPGERVPAGLVFTVTAMSSGATDVTYTAIVTAMGDDQYHTIGCALSASTEVAKLVTELESRSGPLRQIEGVVFAANYDTQPNLTTYGNSFNSAYLVAVGAEKSALLPAPWEVAAAVAAIGAIQAQVHPARAYTGKKLAGYSAAPRGARFTRAERDTLLSDGVATLYAGSDGSLLIERLVTTYQTNAAALVDTAYQDLNTVRTLAALRYSMRARIATKFQNFLLADNGSEVTGQPIATPNIIRGELLNLYQDWTSLGWVEGGAFDQFKAELLVERDLSDPNRVNAIVPPDLMNNFLVGAFSLQFRR